MTKERLTALLNGLPARQRACLLMHRYHNLSASDIAKTLQIGEHDVRDAIGSALFAIWKAEAHVLDVSELSRSVSEYLAHTSGWPADLIAQDILREARAQDALASWNLSKAS